MVERYDFHIVGDASGGMDAESDGDWVKFEDYAAIASKLDASRQAHDESAAALQTALLRLDAVRKYCEDAQFRGFDSSVMTMASAVLGILGSAVEKHVHKYDRTDKNDPHVHWCECGAADNDYIRG
jgi:uncharacterized protein with HEPN domain